MQEIWKDVIGYEEQYQVSNLGNIRSKNRTIVDCLGRRRTLKSHKIRIQTSKIGYKQVLLHKDGKMKTHLVHRLVAEAFIPKTEENKNEINHKDENKSNNTVDNLEWCDHKYNINFGTRTEKTSKKVYQYTKDKKKIDEYQSAWEIHRQLGYDQASICRACNGTQKTAYGYIWSYKELTN